MLTHTFVLTQAEVQSVIISLDCSCDSFVRNPGIQHFFS